MPIYFIQAGEGGPIKIGIASSVAARLSKIQCDCPVALTVLATIEGGIGREAELHAQFAEFATRGEWFSPGADLLGFIATLPKPEPKRRKLKDGDHPLRQYRCANNITTTQLASLLNVTHGTVSRVEMGRVRPTAQFIANVLTITNGAVQPNSFFGLPLAPILATKERVP